MKTIFVRGISVALFLTALLFSGVSFTAEEESEEPAQPLYLGLPFDRLTLTSHYDGASFNVRPIEFVEGHRPSPLPQLGELTVRFVDNPLKEYSIKWSFIESIELFCELVFKEFQQKLDKLTEETRSRFPNSKSWSTLGVSFEELFDYLLFLEDFKDELPQLTAATNKFLFEEAVYRIKSGDYQTGMSRFESLFQRDKEYSGLSKAWGSALDLMLKEVVLDEDYAKARKYLHRFREFFPDHPVIKEWSERIRQAALDRLARSQQAAASKDYLLAHFLIEEAQNISNELVGLNTWRQQLQQEAPRINVAAQDPSDLARLADWGTARRLRLRQRTLSEYVQPSAEGGVYVSPFGTLEKTDRNRTLCWKISPNLHWTGRTEPINAFAVADTLLQLAATNPLDGRTLWNELLSSLDIVLSDELVVRLSRPHLLPEALFGVAVQPSTRFAVPEGRIPESGEALSGPFSPGPPREEKHELFKRTGFQKNRDTVPASETGPKVLVEYRVNRAEEAIELFLSGKVDIIDRVAPWELERLQREPSLIIGRYAIQTQCFLVPNLRRTLPASRTFRRALLYGLNRERMLAKFVSQGVNAEISSGPFIRGTSLADPLGYAFDTSILPRPYEPKLAIALALLAFGQVKEKDKELQGREKVPEIVLARPVHETAQFACLMIRRQWEAIGVPVREVDFRADEKIGQGTDVDFWFVERTVKEPLVDAEAIFGRTGLLGGGSPYMELALEKLRLAEDWPTAAKRLQEIHRLCFEETTVLPLWQISEHFAHRAGINGIRTEPAILNLYQNVERWNVR